MPRTYAPRQPRLTVTCRECSAAFTVTAFKHRQGEGVFCSNPCRVAAAQQNKVDRACVQCGETFRTTRRRIEQGNGKFCSQVCFGQSATKPESLKGYSQERLCEQCATHFFVYPARIKRGEARFCSSRCYGLARRESFATRFWEKFDRSGDCWLWRGQVAANGYGKTAVATDDGPRHVHVHRVAWELTHGQIPTGLKVCHRCDVRHCGRPDHLFLGTQADNLADMVRKGRSLAGDRNPMSRVSKAARSQ